MLPRSVLIAKYFSCNVRTINSINSSEHGYVVLTHCLKRHISFFGKSAKKYNKFNNLIYDGEYNTRSLSTARMLWFSKSSQNDDAKDVHGNTKIDKKSEAIADVHDGVNQVIAIKEDVKIKKEMEMKTKGVKLVAEVSVGSDNNINTITFRKEEPVKLLGAPVESAKVVKRLRVDLTATSLERNFITPMRAMSDFLLKPSDLEALPKIKRRSPYELEPPITVFWRRDVEAKAYEVWGSRENLKKELLRKEIERRRYQQNVFTVKRRLRDFRREMGSNVPQESEGLKGRSGRVVLTAVAINGSNFLFKLFAWVYTGSHSMFSECIHSLADTINQLILAYGIHKSGQIADTAHPYGYTNMRYVASLISGVGIFCVGTGLSYYHGVTGLLHPEPMSSFYWAYFILGGALASEGATLLVAIHAIKKGAKEADLSFKEYVLRGIDPSVNVVLFEDTASVTGVAVAAGFMGLSSYTGNGQWDACGSLVVGTILGCVASFIILTNVGALVGRSIPQDQLDKINSDLESDVMIRAIHDVKGIDMGSNLVRYKAEIDFDGRELARSYLDKQDLNIMLEEVKKLQTIDELEGFMLKHGENIVDMLGGEIDRIELKLRKRFPFLRHCDLEIL